MLTRPTARSSTPNYAPLTYACALTQSDHNQLVITCLSLITSTSLKVTLNAQNNRVNLVYTSIGSICQLLRFLIVSYAIDHHSAVFRPIVTKLGASSLRPLFYNPSKFHRPTSIRSSETYTKMIDGRLS